MAAFRAKGGIGRTTPNLRCLLHSQHEGRLCSSLLCACTLCCPLSLALQASQVRCMHGSIPLSFPATRPLYSPFLVTVPPINLPRYPWPTPRAYQVFHRTDVSAQYSPSPGGLGLSVAPSAAPSLSIQPSIHTWTHETRAYRARQSLVTLHLPFPTRPSL